MRKRIMTLMLSLLLIAAVLPVTASAESSEGARLRQRIEEHYAKTLEANETETLAGYCGTLASYQLYYLGVNSYALMANGNDQYDSYLNSTYTSNGYRIKLYPAEEYTLEEALYAITQGGTRNAYNVLVGFQQTTTEAGSQYGHAVVIYGILDGKVYFTESFGTSFFEKEGMPGVCSISQFAAYYENWTTFEGVVFFGRKGYLDSCDRYNSDMYVQLTKSALMYTLPCNPYRNKDSKTHTRAVRAGEYLAVTALYENPDGEFYYQVQDGDKVCYLEAECAQPVRFNGEDVTVTDLKYPEALKTGSDFTVAGKITSENSLVSSVTLTVTDKAGNIILNHSRGKKGGTYDLSRDTYNIAIDFGTLEEGVYIYTLTADVQSKYLDGETIASGYRQITLCSEMFTVGENTQLPPKGRYAPQFIEDGWTLEDGVWRYYRNGGPWTGWICIGGIDYYLNEGTPTVGWAEINGKERYFAPNGAMCTRWLHTEDGSYYLLKNGQKAIGWRNIGKERYYFNEEGKILSGWQTIEDKTYYFYAEGRAAIDWVELDGKTYYFGTDGALQETTPETQGTEEGSERQKNRQ